MVSPVSLWKEASSTITIIRTCMPVLTRRIRVLATSKKRCTRCGITTTASITQPRTPTRALPALYSFNEFDTGDETTGFRLPSFGDGQNPLTSFDIYMVFNDKVFDNQTGLLRFDLFNTDGILGDKFLVNGKINPVLHVSPRRYRFRWLNTGPSRFYQMFLLGPNNSTKSFWQISTDGNLLERPVQVNSSRFSVAERVDVIVDFTNDAGKTFFIENRLEQEDGRGPSGDVVGAGQGDKILKIVVDGPQVPTTASTRRIFRRARISTASQTPTMRRASRALPVRAWQWPMAGATASLSAVATRPHGSELSGTAWRSGSSKTTRADGSIRSTCTSKSSKPFRSTVMHRRQARD